MLVKKRITNFNKLKSYKKLKYYYKFLSIGFFLLNTSNFLLFNYSYYDKTVDIVFKNYLLSLSSFTYFNVTLPTNLSLQYNIFNNKINKNAFNIFVLFYLKFNNLYKHCNYILSFSNFIFSKEFINVFLQENIETFVDFLYFKLTTHSKFIPFSFLQDFVQKVNIKAIYVKIIRILLFNKLSVFKVFNFKYKYKNLT